MFDHEMRDLAHVHRWGILRRIRQQSVAEHSFFVAIYAIEIAEFIEWQGDHYTLIRAALSHDMPEVRTGDLPGPTKRAVLDAERLDSFESRTMQDLFPTHQNFFRTNGEAGNILAVADILDATLFLADEKNMGNRSVGSRNNPRDPFGSNVQRLLAAVLKLPCQAGVQAALIEKMSEAIDVSVSNIYVDQDHETRT